MIGLLTATIPAVLPAPLHYRALQRARNQALRESQDYDHPCRLSPEAKQDLTWWIRSLHQHNGRSIIPPTPELVMTSDASLEGWEASCRDSQTGGVWSMEERQSHINLLELKAAFLALQVFASQKSNIHILLRIDNTTAIAYLNKKGGTHSRKLSDLAIQVWEWSLSRNLTIQAEHIPGKENEDADRESRRGADSSDWMLHPEVFQELNARWGPLDVDLFAARHNAQLPRFYSYRLDPLAEAVDALNQAWTSLNPYAFPPFILLGRVLQKIRKEKVHQVVLIAPVWPNQHWYPSLLESVSDLPIILPEIPDLLGNPAGEPHTLIEQGRLHLAAWRVSGQASVREAFRRKLSNLSPPPGDRAQKGHMQVHGSSGATGAKDRSWISFQPL